MRVPRLLVLLSSLALTGTTAATITLAGHSAPVAAPVAPAAPVAEVPAAHGPVLLPSPAAKAPAPVRKATRVRPAAPKPTRAAAAHRSTAPTRHVATTAPRPAPRPAQVRTGNDYPWAAATTNAPDTWGFTERQCVSFAAFRLAQHGHALSNSTQGWGSALHWDDTARARGVRISTTPRVGAVAQWNAGEASAVYAGGSSTPNGTFTAGGYGHVGWVAAVYADGSALVEQYNLSGDRSYAVMRMRAPRYLVF